MKKAIMIICLVIPILFVIQTSCLSDSNSVSSKNYQYKNNTKLTLTLKHDQENDIITLLSSRNFSVNNTGKEKENMYKLNFSGNLSHIEENKVFVDYKLEIENADKSGKNEYLKHISANIIIKDNEELVLSEMEDLTIKLKINNIK